MFSCLQTKIKEAFAAFDTNQSGDISMQELRALLGQLGEMPSEKLLQVGQESMREADTDNNGSVSFGELASLMHKLKKDPNSNSAFVRKIHKAPAQVVGPRLPMDPLSEDLFTQTSDGLILCKLINLAEFDTIDARAMNVVSDKRPKLSIFQKIENMNLALNAARGIGCVVTNVNAKDIIDGNSILILGLVWQIIRIQLLSSISLTSCPELVCLLEEGEELDGLLALQPEAILLRWFNYHLEREEVGTVWNVTHSDDNVDSNKNDTRVPYFAMASSSTLVCSLFATFALLVLSIKSSSTKRVKNFGNDLRDGEALSVLLTQLDPTVCQPCNEPPGSEARARHIISNAKAMGAETFIQPADIINANKKLLLAFCAQLFNTNPNLTVEQEVMEQFTEDFANLEDDDEGDTREEKVFRMWINSLAIDNGDLYINNLFADVQNGSAILKVMDRIQPGVVVWKRVNIAPKNRFKKVENGNYVIDIAKVMGLTVVNVGGLDIIDGNRKMTLAIMWQLMRRHTLNLLQARDGGAALSKKGKRIEDPQIVAWANSKVEGSKIRSFGDPSLSTGVCHGIDQSTVNWDLVVMDPANDEDKTNNAKYAISVARKLGACVFVAAEDIVQVMSRMIMLFCASLWHCENERTASPDGVGAGAMPAPAALEQTPQAPKPLMSPTGLRSATSPKPFSSGGWSTFGQSKPPPAGAAAESAAKIAQKKADEETQRRIQAWKAEQQAKQASAAFADENKAAEDEAAASAAATGAAQQAAQEAEAAKAAADAQQQQEAAKAAAKAAEASRLAAEEAEAARVLAAEAEADGVRLAEDQMKAVSLEPGLSTYSDEVTQEEWDA
ncbi:unnamed protein product [Ectocarpus sp. CCAP 1310/34]|nr:unnamed protein product [Ectocarpus sp. CCAP 1310/34]